MAYLSNLKWYKIEDENFEFVDNKPGVYIISTKQMFENMDAVDYVGQSIKLQDRIVEHFSNSEENIDLRNHIKKGYIINVYFSYIEKKYLDGVELYLYNHFDPPFNKNTPPSDEPVKCPVPIDLRKYQ